MNSNRFENNLDHAYAAYRLAASWCLEACEQSFPLDVRGLRVKNRSQLQSALVELGWAFAPRFFTILEQFHRSIGYDCYNEFRSEYLERKLDREDTEGLTQLLKLRNIIVHGDGDEKLVRKVNRLGVPKDSEPHILPEQMERFYRLLKKLIS